MRWCHGLLVAQICPAGRAEFCRTISVWTFMPNCLYHVVLPDSPNSEAIGVFTSKYSMSGLFAFWSGHVGAVAGCRCRVLLSECGVLGCWHRSRASLLWNLGAGAIARGCEMSMAVLGGGAWLRWCLRNVKKGKWLVAAHFFGIFLLSGVYGGWIFLMILMHHSNSLVRLYESRCSEIKQTSKINTESQNRNV